MSSHFSEETTKMISLMLQANHFRQIEEFRKALDIYQGLIESYGETDTVDQVIAYCYFHLGLHGGDEENYKYAVAWIERAISISPRNSQLYDFLGELHSIGTLDYVASIKAYRTAIDLNPNNVHAFVSGAGLYGVPEEVITLEEAINWLEKAVQVEPDNGNNHFNLGMRYHEAGQYSKAEQEWLIALSSPRPVDAVLSKTIIKLLHDT
jgi:tetratricopeptide (TPR) repeat protein